MNDNSMIVVGEVNHQSRLYNFNKFIAKSDSSLLLMHDDYTSRLLNERFDHLNYKYMQQICKKDMVTNLPNIHFSKIVCQGCVLGKCYSPKMPHLCIQDIGPSICILFQTYCWGFLLKTIFWIVYVPCYINILRTHARCMLVIQHTYDCCMLDSPHLPPKVEKKYKITFISVKFTGYGGFPNHFTPFIPFPNWITIFFSYKKRSCVLELLHTHLGFLFPKVFPMFISHYSVSYILGIIFL
jgi:hypothetical protein